MSARRTKVMFVFGFGLAAIGSLAAKAEMPAPVQVAEGQTGQRSGSALVYVPGLQRMLLVGPAKDAPLIQAFDPATRAWSEVSVAAAPSQRFHPYYQTAYDPGTQTLYCLSGSNVLYGFHVVEKTWKSLPPAPELDGLSWHTLACDPEGRRLVVVGADKQADHLGWSRTVVYDLDAGRWSRLEVSDHRVVEVHRQLVALREAVIDLVGNIRLVWFRDPEGSGTDAERKELAERCESIARLPQAAPFAAEGGAILGAIRQRQLLTALEAARSLQRSVELAADEQYPVPCSRRNSPLAFDAKHKMFVLFGGDHEDYLLNDTWVLDLKRGAWQRKKPDLAPSPRAGHALVALPKQGGVLMYEGYLQSSNTDYGATPYAPVDPIALWQYDPPADRWSLLGHWPHPQKDQKASLPPVGHFYGYADEWFSPPAMAADEADRVFLAGQPNPAWYSPWKDSRARTWLFQPDGTRPDAEGRLELGGKPNERRYRSGAFRADYCEVADRSDSSGLLSLPANQWVRLPDSPRNPCRGCRQRDWGTAVWDSDRDQILLWGGGHCVRSASTVVHYSPASGRIVEGFDADEPYGRNGGGGFDSSVLNRPWVSTHNYNHYAYDPLCKLLVSARGYLYDPQRMDWLRMEPVSSPFAFDWGHTVVETSHLGAVAWAMRKDSDEFGLWLFDRKRGWVDLEPKGRLFGPYCDAHGMVFDSRRYRMIMGGVGGGYERTSDGTFLAFNFASRTLETLSPANAAWAKTRNAREMAYVEHADWVLIGDLYRQGDEKTGKLYTRVYDCAKNRMLLLDAGDLGANRDPRELSYSSGWMYDAQRKLAYVFTIRGEAWALRIEPQAAKLLEGAP
jgi:hypothetical protein